LTVSYRHAHIQLCRPVILVMHVVTDRQTGRQTHIHTHTQRERERERERESWSHGVDV